jgi:hypothetical protein
VKGDNQVIDSRRKGAQETLAVFKGPTDGQPFAKHAAAYRSNRDEVPGSRPRLPVSENRASKDPTVKQSHSRSECAKQRGGKQ